jgi:transposase
MNVWSRPRRLRPLDHHAQIHRAGEKVFIDYPGKKPGMVDRQTGEITEVELFVAVLGTSN